MHFCDLWMLYCHSIDDLLDTRFDGRPTMDTEEILKIPIYALLLYNSPFYMAHREALCPVVFLVTNAYGDTVKFEGSAGRHTRAIADVIRCCGNEMFFAVALICGGYDHMRKLSPVIRERSWIIQHTEEGTWP